MKYGQLPTPVGEIKIGSTEIMYYNYLPIKLTGQGFFTMESRIMCFDPIVDRARDDFVKRNGLSAFTRSNVYLTVKRIFQYADKPFNRCGYHCDGFMTDDINYVWYDCEPTIFNTTAFSLTQDDELSMLEMVKQADPINEVTFPPNTLLRLDQFNVHRVNEKNAMGMRTFIKVSFSEDKYTLEGNSVNYRLDTKDWPVVKKQAGRNMPQSKL